MCVPNPPVSRAPPAFSVRLREALAQNHRRVTASFSALSGGARVTASEPQCRITPRSPPPNQRLQPAASPPSKGRAAPSAPISFRRLPAPPAPQPLDCGRRKPLHERAPQRARPRAGPAAAQILAVGEAWTRAPCGCFGGPRLARAPDYCQGLGGGDRERRGRGLLLPCSCLIMVYFLPECLLWCVKERERNPSPLNMRDADSLFRTVWFDLLSVLSPAKRSRKTHCSK